MDSPPKQERSKKRIETILETAETILLEENIDAITIANISKLSGLKRTSTYKFFQTPRNYRKQIKKIEFNLNYNFDQFTVKLDDIKIDDLINKEVNKNLNLLILKDNKLQNRIYLKSLMNQAIKNYAG